MNSALVFQDTVFDVIDRDGQPWVQSRQLASALGYKDESSVRKIFERNQEEFTDSMTATVNLTVGITPVDVRIFSLRGCHLLAMFARTDRAKAFRVWVLDVLETLNKCQRPQVDSAPRPKTSRPDGKRALNAAMERIKQGVKEVTEAQRDVHTALCLMARERPGRYHPAMDQALEAMGRSNFALVACAEAVAFSAWSAASLIR